MDFGQIYKINENYANDSIVKHRVFYSFYYKDDVRRASQIRSIGKLEGDSPVSDNEWEEVKKKDDDSIRRWINKQMKNRSCLVVLVGEHTSERPWVQYEIQHAINEEKAIIGIYINDIKDPLLVKEGKSGISKKGKNPFDKFCVGISTGIKRLSEVVACYSPTPQNAYEDIKNNLSAWVEKAIKETPKMRLVD